MNAFKRMMAWDVSVDRSANMFMLSKETFYPIDLAKPLRMTSIAKVN